MPRKAKLLDYFIGLGEGSSFFDTDVRFKDNLMDDDLAVITVGKISCVLGGGLVAGQTVEGYVDSAVAKIADELEKRFETQRASALGEG
jgi:hypothetical protein